jgi:hypothetical protein
MIRIELPERIANGEHVSGRVTWSAAEGKQARGLQVACGWRIEGKANKREEIVGRAAEEDIGSRAEVSIAFDFEISIEGPLSYDGKLFRIVWEVAAIADLVAGRDEEESKPFIVVARPFEPQEWREGGGRGGREGG